MNKVLNYLSHYCNRPILNPQLFLNKLIVNPQAIGLDSGQQVPKRHQRQT